MSYSHPPTHSPNVSIMVAVRALIEGEGVIKDFHNCRLPIIKHGLIIHTLPKQVQLFGAKCTLITCNNEMKRHDRVLNGEQLQYLLSSYVHKINNPNKTIMVDFSIELFLSIYSTNFNKLSCNSSLTYFHHNPVCFCIPVTIVLK